MAYVNVCRAIYDYTAQDDEELSFQENDVLYIKDTSDPEWWIAQEKSPIMEEEGKKGLIPSTYVEELPYIEVAKTVYDYEARTEEELSFGENEIMYVIEKDDPDWALVKLGDKFGFVPSAYLEPAEDGDSQPHEPEDSHQGDYHEDAPQPLPPKPIQQTPAEPVKEAARPASLAIAEDMEYWSVSEVDKKKKKKKGKLGISSQAIFFFSETDKTPVRKWSFNDVLNFSCKTKHVYIEFGGADAVSFDFHAGSKSEAEKISKKLTECKAKFFTVAAAPIPQVQESVAPAVQNSFAQDAPLEQASSHQNDQYEDTQYQDQYQASNLEQSEAVDELPEPKLAIALYDFEPQNDDELDLRADEQVWVVDDFSSDEWWRCKIVDEQGNEREGVVPASYLQLDDGYPYDDQQYEQDGYNQQEYEQQQYLDDQQEAYEEKPPLPPMPVQKTVDEDIPPPLPPVPMQRFADENTPPPLPPTPTQKYANDSNPPPLPPLPNARSAPSPTQPDAPPLPPKNASIDPKVKPLPEMPPPLAARPSMQSRKSTDDIPLQMIVNANQTSQPKPRSQSSSKPRPSQVRMWSDRSGSFKVEAEFLGLKDGKIHLHKLNGVKIAVPLEKMSVDDLYFIEEFTGKEVPAAAYEGKITVPKRTSSNQSQFDWRAYFIKAGISTEAASKYSSTFNSERMDVSILPDLNREILKDLHIAEGDIIRILKAVKSMDNSPTSRLKPKRSVSFGETSVIPHPETDHDEELARKIQEEEVHQMRDGSARSQNKLQIEKDEQLARELQARENGAARPAQQPLGLNLSGSSGPKLARKGTRPTPSKPAPSAITAESVANAQEKLKKATTSQGFDDDAWGPNGSIINPEPPKKEPSKMVAQPVINSTPIPTTGAFSLETTATPSSPALKSTSSNFTSTWSSAPNSAAMVASPIQKSTPITNSQPFVQQNNFQQSPQVISPQNNFPQSPQVVSPQNNFQQSPQVVSPQNNFQQPPQPLPPQTFRPVNVQANLPPPLVPTPNNNSLPRTFIPTRAPESHNQMDNPFGNSAAISRPPPRPSVEAKGSSIFPQPSNNFRPAVGVNQFQNNSGVPSGIFPKPTAPQQSGNPAQSIFPKPATPQQSGNPAQSIFPRSAAPQQFSSPSQNIFPKPAAANPQSNNFSQSIFPKSTTPQQPNNLSQNIFPKPVVNSGFSQPLNPQQNQSIFPKTGGSSGIFNNSPQALNNAQNMFPKPSPQNVSLNASPSIFPKSNTQPIQSNPQQSIFPKSGAQAQNPGQSLFPRPSPNMLQPTNGNNFNSTSPMFQNTNSLLNTGNQFNNNNQQTQFRPSIPSNMTPNSGIYSSPVGGMNSSMQVQQSSFTMTRSSSGFTSSNNIGSNPGNPPTGFGNQLAIMGSQDLQRSASSNVYGGSNDKYAALQQVNPNAPSVFNNTSQHTSQHQFQQQMFTQGNFQQQNVFMSQQQGQMSSFGNNNMQGNMNNNMNNGRMNGNPNVGNNFFPNPNQQNSNNMNRNNFY